MNPISCFTIQCKTGFHFAYWLYCSSKRFFRSSTALSEFFFRFLYFIFLPGALELKARPAQLSQAVAVKCHSRQFASSSLHLAIHKPIATIATSELDSALNAKSILLSHKEWRNNLCLIDVFTYCNHRYKRDKGRSMGVMEGNCGHYDTRVHNGVDAWITCALSFFQHLTIVENVYV